MKTSSKTWERREPGRRWLIYALGGGLGHVTRSLSLARAAAARGHDVTILSNSPLVDRVGDDGATLEALDPNADREEVEERIAERLHRCDFDLLVVDVFARGLAGELADLLPQLEVPKVLVHRYLCRPYLERFDVHSTLDQYDHVVCPGDQATLPCDSVTPPWLIRDPHECLPRARARNALNLADDVSAVLISASGKASENTQLSKLADALQHSLDGRAEIHLADRWPMLPLLSAFDCVVGGGGYNLTAETSALGIPHVGFAFPRLYDRQAVRIDESLLVHSTTEAIERVAQVLAGLARRTAVPRDQQGGFINGAHQAVERLEAILSTRPVGARTRTRS